MYRILVIEDEALLLWACEQYLSSLGYLVLRAQSAKEAKVLLEIQDVDLVVSDLILPDSREIAAIEEIHRLRPNLPIIAITASLLAEEEMQRVKALAHTILRKPFEMQHLGDLINEILTSITPYDDISGSEKSTNGEELL